MLGWKTIYRLVILTIAWTMGISSCRSFTIHKEPDLPELPYANDLQKAIDQVLLTYPEYDLGISAAVLIPGYRTWTGASGYSHQDVPITADMLFDVGSVHKNFEAALVLKLVEDGKLSLDDPISKYLPTYPYVDGDITIRQLLNHTSGVFNVFEHPDFLGWERMSIMLNCGQPRRFLIISFSNLMARMVIFNIIPVRTICLQLR